MLDQIRKYNLWDGNVPELGFLRTNYTDRIHAATGNNLVKVLIGQRRAGKSFVLRQLAKRLMDEGVPAQNILYINKEYLEFTKQDKLKLKFVKVQKNFFENVISNADYTFLKNALRQDGNMEWYFVVRFLAATGARVSELVQIKVEHIHAGYFDIYTKGGKVRRLFFPVKLRKETTDWLTQQHRATGYLFLNRFGERITTRGIAQQLKNFAMRYGLNPKVIYPHSFRHRYAKNFLDHFNDIALLADLMGHESIETTRIYLRRTANEQRQIVDKVVNW